MPNQEIIEHLDGDFGVTVIYTLDETYTSHVGFFATEIEALQDGEPAVRLYQQLDAVCSLNMVSDPHQAEPFVQGSVKWDGCSNYTVGTSRVMMHSCGRDGLEKLSRVLVAIFERCGELMKERGVDLLEGEFQCG